MACAGVRRGCSMPKRDGVACWNFSASASSMHSASPTRRHLELGARVDGRNENTVLGVLDTTITPMGGRLLRRWLHRPLRDRVVLAQRHHAVGSLLESRIGTTLREAFRALGD